MKHFMFLLILVFSDTLFAQNTNLQKIDQYIAQLNATDQAMGSVAISQDGKLIYTNAFGYTNVEIRDRANPETLYRIGSISKTFTAAIILQLVEEGKISLQTPLSNFYPQIPHAQRITVEQLLNHHSGLANLTDVDDYLDWYTTPQSKIDLLNRIQQAGTDFAPGTKAEYSNTNYILLTLIAEDIEHKDFSEIIQKRITTPLQLKRTQVGSKIKSNHNEAYSYSFEDGVWKRTPETDMSIPLGAGNVISTPKELNRFFSDLFNHKLLNDSIFNKMITPQDGFGLGLFKIPFRDKISYGHNGGIDGFRSIAVYFPKEKTAISICLNATRIDVNDIILGILNLYFGYPYTIPSFSKITSSEQFTGTYSASDFPLKISTSVESGNLYLQATGQSKIPMIRQSKTVFIYPTISLKIEFSPEKHQLKLTQNNKTHLLQQE